MRKRKSRIEGPWIMSPAMWTIGALCLIAVPVYSWADASNRSDDVLEALNPAQLEEFLDGAPAEAVVLSNGESLVDLLKQLGSSFGLDWSTVDSGGATDESAAGVFELTGTIGQPDAGRAEGSDFELMGGFWVDLSEPESAIFGDGFESGDASAWSSVMGR